MHRSLFGTLWAAFMAFLLLTGAVAAAPAPSMPDLAPDGVLTDLPRDWAEGEVRHLTVLEEREHYRGTGRLSGGGVQFPVEIAVLEKRKGGHLMRWTWGPAELLPDSDARTQLTLRLSRQLARLSVDVRLDEAGMPVAVENLAEVVASKHTAAALMRQELARNGMAEAELRAFDSAQSVLLQDAAVEAHALQDLRRFHLATGASLSLVEPVHYDDLLPNLLGGVPFPSAAVFELVAADTAAGTATFHWAQETDRERGGPIVLAVARQLARQTGEALPADAPLPHLTINDAATSEMDVATGWPLSVHFERTVTLGSDRIVERYTYETVEPATPTAQIGRRAPD